MSKYKANVIDKEYYLIKTIGNSTLSNITTLFFQNSDFSNKDDSSSDFGWYLDNRTRIESYVSNNSETNVLMFSYYSYYPLKSSIKVCSTIIKNLTPGQYILSFYRCSGTNGNIKYESYYPKNSWYDEYGVDYTTQFCNFQIKRNNTILYNEEYNEKNKSNNIGNDFLFSIIPLSKYDIWCKTFIEEDRNKLTSDKNKRYYGNLSYKMNMAYYESFIKYSSKFAINYKTSISFNVASKTDKIEFSCYYNNTYYDFTYNKFYTSYGLHHIGIRGFQLEYKSLDNQI